MSINTDDMVPSLDSNEDEANLQQDDEIAVSVDDWDLPICYNERRHLEPIKGDERAEHTWRLKEKYKTHCVALVLCLNVGVDPPDVVKTQPCARLECWIDPASMSPTKALESVGHALQAQYERWQPRARYKQSLDPTIDEVKKLCCSLRRNAKDERVLFHYNGHGVPKPTNQGEIWVFNRAYTQYIPLSMYDLQTWMGAPSLYVYECSNAGVIVDNFLQFAEQHEREQDAPPVCYKNCIQLAACAAGQTLPMNAELPADLFTSCLTTPVKMALRWFVAHRRRPAAAPPALADLLDKIPGQVTDRRTMLGELNWIFTAITDTIAWSSLDSDVFQRLFRADLLTASLCRNFLLAERVMRDYNCTPVSHPPLPATARHPLWPAWEHAVELALSQLGAGEYRGSAFFRDQLTAFCVWLQRPGPARPPPDQLPMVLQVLLSTLHRVRALQILCRYLALGEGAVRALLHVGIFPYMLKLLQASAQDLRPTMVYIWAKIIAVDPSCQVDLVNAKGHKYFLAVLQDPTVDEEHRTLAAYVLAGIVDGYPGGQDAALQAGMVAVCLEALQAPGERTRRWAALGLARLWAGQDAARWAGLRDLAHEKLYPLLTRAEPETRAAAARALAALLSRHPADHALNVHRQVGAALAQALATDASSLVRMEILNALQWLVLTFEQYFVAAAQQQRERGARVEWCVEATSSASPPRRLPPTPPLPAPTLPTVGFGSVYVKVWSGVVSAGKDPHPGVASMARDLISHVEAQLEVVTGPRGVRDEPRGGRDETKARGPIVTTQYELWAAAEVARPDPPRRPDPESADHHDRVWRYARNKAIRQQAKGGSCRLEAQAFHSRCPQQPAVLAFHPYEQHLALASHDNFGIWDWGTGAKLCVGSWKRPSLGRISDVAYLNAHDRALLCVASHRGNVCVYRCGGGALAGAWRALPPTAASTGTLLAWRSASADLLVAGAAPLARYWDLVAEREALTVNIDSEAPVTALSRVGRTATAGFADGAVRWWDERSPVPVSARRSHGARVLAARARPDLHRRVSVCADGRVVVTDTRTERPVAESAVGGATAARVHAVLDVAAVGAASQAVLVLDLSGNTLHTIRSYEGFMGSRIGAVSCLALHPLRPAMAVGACDCTVSVYVPDRR